MKGNKLLLLISLLIIVKMTGQIIPVSIEYKITNSSVIIEGQILSKQSKENESKSTIFTDYKVKVISIQKGIIDQEFITIRTLGGSVGEKTLLVCPNSYFEVQEQGTYFISKIADGIYEPTYLGQSEYPDQKLERNRDNKFELQNYPSIIRSTLATITSISPLTVNAGVGDVVTITGSGFGATPPPSGQKVWVRNANNPTQYISQSNWFNYVSWSDTEIKYKVSSDASTGKILVGFAASNVESLQTLQVNYNVRDNPNFNNSNIYPISLPSLVSGGILFVKNTNFTNTDAINSTLIAMDSWTCETGIKMDIDPVNITSNINVSNDNQSVLFFANLGATTLGVTYTTSTACSATGRYYVSDVDLAINSTINFNYTLNSSILGQYDYYTTVLHELGHVRNLTHVNDTNDVMHYGISAGVARRSLNTNNTNGGLWVQNDSQTVSTCSKPLMTTGTCQNLSSDDFENTKFEFYPNPIINKLYIKTDKQIQSAELYDTNSKKINVNIDQNSIDFSNISNGIYLIKLFTKDGYISKKIIKQ